MWISQLRHWDLSFIRKSISKTHYFEWRNLADSVRAGVLKLFRNVPPLAILPIKPTLLQIQKALN